MPQRRTVVAVAGVLLPLALNCSLAWARPAVPIAASRPRPVDAHRPGGPEASPGLTNRLPGHHDRDRTGGGSVIHLATGAFDPLVEVPDVPAGLRAEPAGHWLVQVHGRPSGAVRAGILKAGGQILRHLPEATYLVRADATVAGALARLPAVRWVGPYHPAYKISPALAAFGTGEVSVWAQPGTPVAGAAGLAGQVAGVAGVSRVRAAGDRLVVATLNRSQLPAVARLDGVEWVEARPRYQLHNANALWVSDTGVRDELGAAAPGRLDGAGQASAVADTGVNYVPVDDHPAQLAFADCGAASCLPADYVQGRPGTKPEELESVTATGAHHRKMAAYLALADDPLPRSTEPGWHGTHVAGTLAGDYPEPGGGYGTRSRESDGVAPAARLVFQDIEAGGGLDLPDDPYQLFAQAYDLNGNGAYDAAEDARVHSNSYGTVPGLDTKAQAARLDDFMVDHPDLLVVLSAGNSGPDPFTLPAGGQLAKNGLVVCASENGAQPLAPPDTAAPFSSHGPTPDGRLKPDVCAPGQVLVSPKGGTADDDHYLQGTSMSAPVAAGLAVLARQYFWDGFGPAGGTGYAPGTGDPARRHNPSAALVKAVLVNAAQRMRGLSTGDAGGQRAQDGMWPSAGQGFGRVQLDDTLSFAGEHRTLFVADAAGGLETGDTAVFTLDAVPGQPLAVTLAWTDPSSGLAAGSPALVNDLDLEVTGPDGTLYLGNEFNTQSPLLGPGGDPKAAVGQSVSGGTPDRANNLEAFRLADPRPGRYTVRVVGTGVGLGPQRFALVASGRLATDTPRISFDAPKARPGTSVGAYLLGTGLSGAAVDGFTRVGPSVYRASLRVGREGAIARAGGVEATLPADSAPPAIAGVEVESVSADLTLIRWSTDEPSTGEVVLRTPAGSRRLPDVENVSTFPGLEGETVETVETKSDYVDRPVLSTRHRVLVPGLAPGAAYDYEITSVDQAGNRGRAGAGRFTSTDAVYAPAPPDIAQLRSADPGTGRPLSGREQQWGRSLQLFAGRLTGDPDVAVPATPVEPVTGQHPVDLLPAFMFRLPDGLDPQRVTGASVQLFSAHDFVAATDRPAYSLDLLASGVEEGWGPGTSYETMERAPPDVHLVPEPTLPRGGNVAYSFAVACNDLGVLQANLSRDRAGARALAFRLRSLSPAPQSAFSFESGFGARSRGPQLRPRLLLHLDGADPLPCTDTPTPTITDVLVDHLADKAAVVSWRTDVPADSTVYFREAGTSEWTPVGSPLRVTQHFVRVGGLRPLGAYEFVVRSANCRGAATVDDNRGSAYGLFPEAYRPPVIAGVFAGAEPGGGVRVGWTTDQPSTSVLRVGLAPEALDREVTGPGGEQEHRLALPLLASCRIHYFVVESANEAGRRARSPVFAFVPSTGGPVARATFDFSDGNQGFAERSPGVRGAPADARGPTSWRRRLEPTLGGSQAMRTVLRDAVPGYGAGADVRLVSPPVVLPPGPGALRWREWYRLTGEGEAARVEISADDGATWTLLRGESGSENEGFPQPALSERRIDPAFTGRPVRVAFRLVTDDGVRSLGGLPLGGWAVDDIAFLTPRCDPSGTAPGVAVAPATPPPPERARVPERPRPPVSAGAVTIGPLPPPGGPPAARSVAAGTAACGSSAKVAPATPGAGPAGPDPPPADPGARRPGPDGWLPLEQERAFRMSKANLLS